MYVWNVDPVLVHIGPLQIRYYGVCFLVGLLGGYLLWRWQMLRAGRSEEAAERILMPAVLAVIVGARLGHVIFYEPGYFFSHPVRILAFWEGGLASHGAAIALVITLWWYSRREKMSMEEVADRFSFSIAWAAAWVRIGNFMNSEIVGRVTGVSWGVKFPRFDYLLSPEKVPYRHPSQIYEALMGFLILFLLLLADKLLGGEKRPRGVMISLCLILYFSGRFLVEFVKEYQALSPESSPLTEGQYLSIPFIIAGFVWLFISLRRNLAA
ncbi:prolipoprotein diacylglyceryl transferase [bacterium]|nr:MAG: prolipoprotein diacylglyceryl transferase [bacterium]